MTFWKRQSCGRGQPAVVGVGAWGQTVKHRARGTLGDSGGRETALLARDAADLPEPAERATQSSDTHVDLGPSLTVPNGAALSQALGSRREDGGTGCPISSVLL